jgi:hypothetical protein
MPKAPKAKSADNTSILEYALSHLERESAEILAKIDHVKRQLGWSSKASAAPVAEEAEPAAVTPAASVPGGRKKRVLSPAARKRIALAQKRRWAAHRKAKAVKE